MLKQQQQNQSLNFDKSIIKKNFIDTFQITVIDNKKQNKAQQIQNYFNSKYFLCAICMAHYFVDNVILTKAYNLFFSHKLKNCYIIQLQNKW